MKASTFKAIVVCLDVFAAVLLGIATATVLGLNPARAACWLDWTQLSILLAIYLPTRLWVASLKRDIERRLRELELRSEERRQCSSGDKGGRS